MTNQTDPVELPPIPEADGYIDKTLINGEIVGIGAITQMHALDYARQAIQADRAKHAMPATVPDNMQDWAKLDHAVAWHLIERHADNWADIGKMMDEFVAAKIGADRAKRKHPSYDVDCCQGHAPESECKCAVHDAAKPFAGPVLTDGETRISVMEPNQAFTPPDCWCETCRPISGANVRMVLCPTCGNKRCPHAADHRNACTGSNEPGQSGSSYPAPLQNRPQIIPEIIPSADSEEQS